MKFFESFQFIPSLIIIISHVCIQWLILCTVHMCIPNGICIHFFNGHFISFHRLHIRLLSMGCYYAHAFEFTLFSASVHFLNQKYSLLSINLIAYLFFAIRFTVYLNQICILHKKICTNSLSPSVSTLHLSSISD